MSTGINNIFIMFCLIAAISPSRLAQSTPPPQLPISIVDQEPISIEHYQERCRLDRWNTALFFRNLYEQGNLDWQQVPDVYSEALYLLQHPQIHGERMLSLMERELIVKHAAEARGITVEQSSVDDLLKEDIAWLSNINSPDDFFQKAMKEVGVDRETINEVYFYQVLWQSLFANITAGIPIEEFQLHVRYILLAFNPNDPFENGSTSNQQHADALTRAKNILGLLQQGTSFADLARKFSDDQYSALNGGDAAWAGETGFLPSLWETVKDAPVGSIVGPVETQYGYFIIEILDRGFHPIQPQVLAQRQQELFTEWLEGETAKVKIERIPDWEQYIPFSPSFEELMQGLNGLSPTPGRKAS